MLAGQPGAGPGGPGAVQGFHDRFGGEHERGPVHGRHPHGPQVEAGLDGLLRVGVDVAEPPARGVGADRQQGEVDAGVAAADLVEPVAVAGVTREVDLPRRPAPGVGEDPAAPQRPAGVDQGPLGPVVRGDELEAYAVQFGRFPPVEIGDPGEAAAAEPAGEAGRDEEGRVPGQALERGGVEVVVVVVADHHRVHRRQVLPAHPDGVIRAGVPRIRRDQTGSVSTVSPPVRSTQLACPAQVTETVPGARRAAGRARRAGPGCRAALRDRAGRRPPARAGRRRGRRGAGRSAGPRRSRATDGVRRAGAGRTGARAPAVQVVALVSAAPVPAGARAAGRRRAGPAPWTRRRRPGQGRRGRRPSGPSSGSLRSPGRGSRVGAVGSGVHRGAS